MRVALYRIDERLIHGQVMTAWIGKTGANSVVIVDEALSKDDFMQQVLSLAAPANIKVLIVDKSKFIDLIGKEDNLRSIVLFKSPQSALDALTQDVNPAELIVGNVAPNPKREKYTRYAYLTPEEKSMFTTIQGLGWKVYMQLLPDDSKKEFAV